MSAIKRIVVAIDFSKLSRLALDYAIDLAGDVGARIHVLYVVEPLEFSGIDVFGGAPVATQSIVEEHLRPAKAEMETLRAKRLSGLAGAKATVELGRPADVICETGGKGRSNLIVIGTHGRSGLAHLVMGSVAERVARHAQCPVLIVPTGESRTKR